MPIYEFGCSQCGSRREAMMSYDEMKNTREHVAAGNPLTCPGCGDSSGAYREVFTKAPSFRMGGSGSPRDIAALQKDCRERFVKSGEMDDIRHKHGSAFDDSIRGAAVERIKNAKGI